MNLMDSILQLDLSYLMVFKRIRSKIIIQSNVCYTGTADCVKMINNNRHAEQYPVIHMMKIISPTEVIGQVGPSLA